VGAGADALAATAGGAAVVAVVPGASAQPARRVRPNAAIPTRRPRAIRRGRRCKRSSKGRTVAGLDAALGQRADLAGLRLVIIVIIVGGRGGGVIVVVVGGRGGGRDDIAQGGGTDGSRAADALKAVESAIGDVLQSS
jgi:hypothetical protein